MAELPFTLDDIAEAYRLCDLEPMAGRYLSSTCRRACPLGALMAAKLKCKPELVDILLTTEILGITEDQENSFAQGFDLEPDAETDETIDDPDAFQLGRTARKRFLPEPLI